MELDDVVVDSQEVPELHHAAARHVIAGEVESPDACVPHDALEEDVDGVAGEAAVGQVQQGHLVSAGQEGGESVVEREGVASYSIFFIFP